MRSIFARVRLSNSVGRKGVWIEASLPFQVMQRTVQMRCYRDAALAVLEAIVRLAGNQVPPRVRTLPRVSVPIMSAPCAFHGLVHRQVGGNQFSYTRAEGKPCPAAAIAVADFISPA